MTLSRIALVALVAMAAGGVTVSYAAAPAPIMIGQAKSPITVKAGNYDLISQVIDLPPGGMVPKHTHGGPVVGQVVTGELTFTDASGERVVKTGETFRENPGAVHWVMNKGSVPVRVAVSYLIPKGAAVITMVK